MGYSKVQICNLALQSQGANPITDLTQNSKEAKLCNAFFDLARDMVLDEMNWAFAKKWATLASDSNAVILDSRYTYAYVLPPDLIRLSRTGDTLVNYERRGNHIMSNDEVFKVEYVYRIEDTGLYPMYFVNAFAARLRAELSVPLTESGAQLVNWFDVYSAILARSMASDAQQSNFYQADDYHDTDADDTFLSSRN